ncbi:MAG TPA: class I SAM-dependent methyltransferase [Thermoplasmata archaeon]|nr:class I SAM-dependent methyltransferase [Thermoplasmata archaeon]
MGVGPGRFTPHLGRSSSRRVMLDLSVNMLKEAGRRFAVALPHEPGPDLVRGDAAYPPFRGGRFSLVVALGNVVGFAGPDAGRVLDRAIELVQPGGMIVLESVVDSGERSRYLGRLPPGAVRRLLVAPINAVRPRLEREGFRAEPAVGGASSFQRMREDDLAARLSAAGFDVSESMAVAPALGADPDRISAARTEPAAWRHLLELEEVLGRIPARRARAAALLVAAERTRS